MSDYWMAWVWCAVNTLLVAAAWRVSRHLYPGDSTVQYVVHTTVLSIGCVTVCGVILGSLQCVVPIAYLLLVAATAACAHVAVSLLPSASRYPNESADGRQEVRLWGTLCGFWVCLLLGVPMANAVGAFPEDFDALWYHLPLVDHWLQANSLYAPDACFWFYPANGELVTLWVVGPFSGDFLAGLTNLPAIVLLTAAAVECGTTAGLSRPVAFLSAMVIVTHPVAEMQVRGLGNDLWTAALTLAGLWYGMRAVTSLGRQDLVLCGACAGMLAGVKYYALGYAMLTMAAVLARILDLHGYRAALRTGAVVLLAAGSTGGYWYARNAVVTGSPLYPKAITTSASDEYTQKHPGFWQSSFFGNTDPAVLPLTSAAVGKFYGPGLWVTFVVGPLAAGWLTVSSMHGQSGPRDTRVIMAAMVSGSGLLLGFTPNAVEDDPGTLNALRWGYPLTRFALCYVSLSVIGIALAIQIIFGRAVRLRPRAFIGYCARVATLGPPMALGVLLVVQLDYFVAGRANWPWLDVVLVASSTAIIGTTAAHALRALPRLGQGVAFGVAWFAAVWIAAASIEQHSDHWHNRFARHYDDLFDTPVFSELKVADHTTVRIGFHGYRGYPFFGSRRQLAVCQPFYTPSASWLTQYLRDRRVTHVAVFRPPTAPAQGKGTYFWWFDRCLAESPGCFQPTGHGSEFTLFLVRPECR